MQVPNVKNIWVVFLMIPGLFIALSCNNQEAQSEANSGVAETIVSDLEVFPYSILDSDGNEVVFYGPPERIIAIDSSAVEILFSLGQEHRLVGTHDFVSYPPEVAGIPRIGDAFNLNLESIVDLDPDLVFVFSKGFLPDLSRAGLKVLYLDSLNTSFRDIPQNIRMWGHITGNTKRAEIEASKIETRIIQMQEVISTRPVGPSIFLDDGDFWTPGSDTMIGEAFEFLNLQNIAYDISGYEQLSPEIIVYRDPQIIIAMSGNTISEIPSFKNISAVKNEKIFVPKSDSLAIAGPRFIDAIEELYLWIYSNDVW